MFISHDRLRGLVYGQAIGDALGLGAEFMTPDEVQRLYPEGLTEFAQVCRSPHSRAWTPGEWTDDTEQFLDVAEVLAESLGAGRSIALQELAGRFLAWARRDGRGIGQLTFRILSNKEYLANPQRVARQIWEASARRSAPNGAVMRTAILGALDWEKNLLGAAETVRAVCELTHADPRCSWSCLVIAFVAACLLRGDAMVERACERALACGRVLRLDQAAGEEAESWIDLALAGERDVSLERLSLGRGQGQGYTFRTMAAALWAVAHSEDFPDCLLPVVNSGGDADTNGAVTGALLGARYGFKNLPGAWVAGLLGAERLEALLCRLSVANKKVN